MQHLRCHVVGCAAQREGAELDGAGLVDEGDLLGKAEVHDLEVPLGVDQQVLRLQVAVAVAQSVDVLQC